MFADLYYQDCTMYLDAVLFGHMLMNNLRLRLLHPFRAEVWPKTCLYRVHLRDLRVSHPYLFAQNHC
jgi:hypothetical protein